MVGIHFHLLVMLHSANRGHWRDGANSIAPKENRGTISAGLLAAEGLRSSPGSICLLDGSLSWLDS